MALKLQDCQIGYCYKVKQPDVEIKKFHENSAFVVSDFCCISLRMDGQQFKWKHDSTLSQHTLYVKLVVGSGKEPSEVKFKKESGEEYSFGTFSRFPPHLYMVKCFVKFEEDVTFSLFGPGPVEIFISEIKKPKEENWWKGVKEFLNKYIWKANPSQAKED